ncbi:hypothetical protein D3C76_902810 [compost metagenome]
MRQADLVLAPQLDLQRSEVRRQFTLHCRPTLGRDLLKALDNELLHALGLVQVVGDEALMKRPDNGVGDQQQGTGVRGDDHQVQANQDFQHTGVRTPTRGG